MKWKAHRNSIICQLAIMTHKHYPTIMTMTSSQCSKSTRSEQGSWFFFLLSFSSPLHWRYFLLSFIFLFRLTFRWNEGVSRTPSDVQSMNILISEDENEPFIWTVENVPMGRRFIDVEPKFWFLRTNSFMMCFKNKNMKKQD